MIEFVVSTANVALNNDWVQIGIPFKKGTMSQVAAADLVVIDPQGKKAKAQLSDLAFWHDGSVKWGQVSFVTSVPANSEVNFTLSEDKSFEPTFSPLVINTSEDRVEIKTANRSFSVSKHLVSLATGQHYLEPSFCDEKGHRYNALATDVQIDQGILSTRVNLLGHFVHNEQVFKGLAFQLSLQFFAHCEQLKFQFTIHNEKAAKHHGGLWDLGDEASILFESLQFELNTQTIVHSDLTNLHQPDQVFALAAADKSRDRHCLTQFSSGGENWQSPVHIDAKGNLPFEKKGFELYQCQLSANSNQETLISGERFDPLLACQLATEKFAFYPEKFWQNFPKAIHISDDQLVYALFPNQGDHLYELQGGEKKTHKFWLDFSNESNLDVKAQGYQTRLSTEYIASTKSVFAFAAVQKEEISPIIEQGLTGEANFFAKRERLDEYGWRHFGDIFADHETYGYEGDDIFVSHYNNQYDPLWGFLRQYLSTGQQKWLDLANELAIHIQDIDIYHTLEDRDEYNGGLFWHTDHYLPALTSSHRTHSKDHTPVYDGFSMGGGPGGQHCYTSGLAHHYFITGDERSKSAVLQLAKWIQYFYEGSNTIIGQLFGIKNSNLIGVKNQLTGQYPLDRGTGNYIQAQLDAFSVTNDRRYLDKAFHIIEHTIHPLDDIEQRNLTDVEGTWFYTVLLQAAARYLFTKLELEELDDAFYYVRDALLGYVDWMVEHEYPYLDKPDILEYPNHTWAAQDIRKANLFYLAYFFSPEQESNIAQRYKAKADSFYSYVEQTLAAEPTRQYSRILAILMQNFGVQSFAVENKKEHAFSSRRTYQPVKSPGKLNKILRCCRLLGCQIIKLSPSRELSWLARRSEKINQMLGERF
ncbi:hypothetical protein HR060_15575 [Catenovulum sp. SM1970]|uniref:RIFT barrel domain-containing protein n=1 Tax=Marinifaba aquimaris TaxID=2741323 RepID=UPI001571F818|nr:hypothetical protein [Marinifaba aquimaris]NTS78271.1 hypothetical protein [Marinifaba aquimaris]